MGPAGRRGGVDGGCCVCGSPNGRPGKSWGNRRSWRKVTTQDGCANCFFLDEVVTSIPEHHDQTPTPEQTNSRGVWLKAK